jgi:hypothetical protein
MQAGDQEEHFGFFDPAILTRRTYHSRQPLKSFLAEPSIPLCRPPDERVQPRHGVRRIGPQTGVSTDDGRQGGGLGLRPFVSLDARSRRKRISKPKLCRLLSPTNGVVAGMAAENEIVPKIALEKGSCAKKRASKLTSAPEFAQGLTRALSLRRSFRTLCQISTDEMNESHPSPAGFLGFYSYTRQTGAET